MFAPIGLRVAHDIDSCRKTSFTFPVDNVIVHWTLSSQGLVVQGIPVAAMKGLYRRDIVQFDKARPERLPGRLLFSLLNVVDDKLKVVKEEMVVVVSQVGGWRVRLRGDVSRFEVGHNQTH